MGFVHLTVRIISTFIFLSTFHEQVCLHVFINYRKFSFVSRTDSFVSLGLPLVHGKGELGARHFFSWKKGAF